MNKNTIYLALLSAIALKAFPASAEIWTYADCVEHARSHNITLRKLLLSEQSSDCLLDEAKAQWQPTLDFATTHGYTNTPWGDGNKNIYNGQLGLNAGWTVWNGGQREKTIERNRLNTEKSRIDTEDQFRSIETDLLQVYVNILYAREAVAIYQEAEKLSKAQEERMRQLMEAGRASKVDYAQIKAQHEQDMYNLVNARGTFETRRMELKKILELGIEDDVQLASPDITTETVMQPLPSIEESYELAVLTDTKLKGLKLDEEGADLDVDIAKAAGRPRIALNAGVGTSYYAPGGAFGNQLKQAVNENIALSLSVPILDNKKVRTAVAQAKIQKLNTQLDSELRLTELAQAVENWYIDTRSAQSRFLAAEQQVEAAMTSNELTNEQFKLGLINTIELMTAHNNLIQARQSLLQSKYMALLGQKMIQYYRTAIITI